MRGDRVLATALASITAAVVGVVLNLAVWFSLQTLFGVVRDHHIGPATISWPAAETLSWSSLAIALLAFLLMFRFHRGMLLTLAVCATLGALATWARQ